jgi:hypothetical protein
MQGDKPCLIVCPLPRENVGISRGQKQKCEPHMVHSIMREMRPGEDCTAAKILTRAMILIGRSWIKCLQALHGTLRPHALHSLEMVLIEFTMMVVGGADLPVSDVSLSVGDSIPMTLTSFPR